MKKDPLFRKKLKFPEGKVTETSSPEEQPSTSEIEEGVATNEEGAQVDQAQEKEPVEYDSDDSGTVRLSCDLPRKHHRALRIAAAHCERSITEMLETLLECHLVHRQIDSIVKDYHKSRNVWFRLK